MQPWIRAVCSLVILFSTGTHISSEPSDRHHYSYDSSEDRADSQILWFEKIITDHDDWWKEAREQGDGHYHNPYTEELQEEPHAERPGDLHFENGILFSRTLDAAQSGKRTSNKIQDYKTEMAYSVEDFSYAEKIAYDYNKHWPVPDAGEKGEGVAMTPKEEETSKSMYFINQFNIIVSDKIRAGRTLPDNRSSECTSAKTQKAYRSASIPNTSVIIVFHNEAWSTLMRTLHSVILRSPRRMLREIILVDDASERSFLKEPLHEHVKQITDTDIRIVHSLQRLGLMKARTIGARIAKGQVLTFVDAHCECHRGWLVPLLFEISRDRKVVVTPTIDLIDSNTFQYVYSVSPIVGGFGWKLQFSWFQPRDDDPHAHPVEPTKTPVMAGGIFAIDRRFFFELGAYDPDQKIWGGENLEFSFRIWRCGGSIATLPCSRIGHVFRTVSPYSFPGGVDKVIHTNTIRTLETWVDDYKDFFYFMLPEVKPYRDGVDVSDRLKLREKLQCHSMQWYLDNIYPNNFFPFRHRYFGRIKNVASQTCLTVIFHGRPNSECNYKFDECTEAWQYFFENDNHQWRGDENLCAHGQGGIVRFIPCTLTGREYVAEQEFHYNQETGAFRHKRSGLCMDISTSESMKIPTVVRLQPCDQSVEQQWALLPASWK